jgi:hypothetical protein
MRAITTFAVLVVLQSALFGCVASPVDPQHLGAQTPPPSFTVDPQANPEVWGVYSRLVGHRYAPPTGGFPGFEVRWSEPGKAIIETSLFLEGAIVGPDVKWSRTIRPGSKAGELNMDFNGTPWLGTIESDGSVVFKAVTPRSGDFPYRIRLSSRGEMLVQNLQWVNGSLSDVIYSTPYPVESMPSGPGSTVAEVSRGAPPTTHSDSGVKPLELGQKVIGKLDDNSQKTSIMRTRYDLYRLPARKGESVVVGLDCDTSSFYGCYYTLVNLREGYGNTYEAMVDAPKRKAYRFTLTEDHQVLKVESNGTLDYGFVVEQGAAGNELWAATQAELTAFDQAKARQDAADSAENAQLLGAVMQGLNQGLTAANQEARANTAQSSASLAATLAQARAQPPVSPSVQASQTPSSSSDHSTAQDAQVAALMAQNQALMREMGIESEANAMAADMLAQIERQQAPSRVPSVVEEQEDEAPTAEPEKPTAEAAPAKHGELIKTVKGQSYSVGATLPAQIEGRYLYEGEGEPIVLIESGSMQSRFQPHQDPEIPMTAWIVQGPDGSPLREKGVGERYQVTLVVEYGAGGGGNYPEGSLDLLPVVVAPDMKKAFILGERVKDGL